MTKETAIKLWNTLGRDLVSGETKEFGGAMLALGADDFLSCKPDYFESSTKIQDRVDSYERAAKALLKWAKALQK